MRIGDVMINLLNSFAGGLCFAFGAFCGVAVCAWAVRKKDDERINEANALSKRIEDRMATQVATMVACLEEIKKRKES